MYIQITDRCNMSCAHCGMNCTEEGQDMSMETFMQALTFCDSDIFLTIGGGEPTLHPEFKTMLIEAIAISGDIWLVTNGSQTEISLLLARLARRGVIGVALSLDEWHDPIDCEVMDAFGDRYPGRNGWVPVSDDNDRREVRIVTEIVKAGRAKEWGNSDDCICDDVFIDPSGTIWQCGCKKKKLGTVFDRDIDWSYSHEYDYED